MTDLLKDGDLFVHIEGWMLNGQSDRELTIRRVEKTELVTDRGRSEKWCLIFQETGKSLLLNKTNAKGLIQQLGPDTENWTGASVVLFAVPLKVKGEPTYGVRLRRVTPPAKENGKPKQKTPEGEGLNKELFN